MPLTHKELVSKVKNILLVDFFFFAYYTYYDIYGINVCYNDVAIMINTLGIELLLIDDLKVFKHAIYPFILHAIYVIWIYVMHTSECYKKSGIIGTDTFCMPKFNPGSMVFYPILALKSYFTLKALYICIKNLYKHCKEQRENRQSQVRVDVQPPAPPPVNIIVKNWPPVSPV